MRRLIQAVSIAFSCFLLFFSCGIPFEAARGNAWLSMRVRLPESRASKGLDGAQATVFDDIAHRLAGARGRFLHPDTRFIALSVSGESLRAPVTASVDLSDGERAATLSLGALESGRLYHVSVMAYDGPEGNPLSSGSLDVELEAGGNELSLGLIPVEPTTHEPGRNDTEWTTGDFAVFGVDLPVADEYLFSALDNNGDPFPIFGLYGPDGKAVAGYGNDPSLAGYGRFLAPSPGTYYLAVQRPALYGVTVTLNVDIYFSFEILNDVWVMDDLWIYDYRSPLIFDCSVPVRSVNSLASVNLPDAAPIASISGSRIVILPGDGEWSAELALPGFRDVNIVVVDDVFGEERIINYQRGMFKKFIYTRSSGQAGGTGTQVNPCSSLSSAISNASASDSAIVLLGGDALVQQTNATISQDALFVGGCVETGGYWYRNPAGRGRTSCSFPGTAFSVQNTYADTIITGIDFSRPDPGSTLASLIPLVSVGQGGPVFHDCRFTTPGFAYDISGATAWSLVYCDEFSTPLLRQCIIDAGAISNLSPAGQASMALCGIRAEVDVNLVSSVVRGPTVTIANYPTGTGRFGAYGMELMASASHIVNSTIYSGRLVETWNPDPIYANAAILTNTSNVGVELLNSILLTDTGSGKYDGYYAAPVLNISATNPFSACSYNSFASDFDYAIIYGTTRILPEDLGSHNNYFPFTSFHFLDPASADFHLTGASPYDVRTGGADVSTGFSLATDIIAASLVDPAGVSRGGSWSIGAYEYQ